MGKGKHKHRQHGTERTTMAERADPHDLYQRSVQDVETEINFVDEVYEELRDRPARSLREDFSGTAGTSCEWVGRREDNVAWAVDLDETTLEWGRQHNLSKLSPDALARVHLIHGDVLTATTPGMDILLAMNFSYWIFKTRDELRSYFEAARSNLDDDGILFLDCFGGYEAYQEMKESRKCDGFKYIWDQAEYNPITGGMTCKIHFRFPDASRINDAFTYHWRLWSLPELRELLVEAGFSQVDVYWEGDDEDDPDEGSGEYEATLQGEADAGWIVYIVAQK